MSIMSYLDLSGPAAITTRITHPTPSRHHITSCLNPSTPAVQFAIHSIMSSFNHPPIQPQNRHPPRTYKCTLTHAHRSPPNGHDDLPPRDGSAGMPQLHGDIIARPGRRIGVVWTDDAGLGWAICGTSVQYYVYLYVDKTRQDKRLSSNPPSP